MRLDDEALAALGRLEATGMTRSEAIRRAIVDAAEGVRKRHALAAEVAELERDPDDRREMMEIAELMESLREPR